MKKIKVGIKEISEKSGFSPATVSNVINGKKGVNRETTDLILKIARETGYINKNKINSIRLVVYKKHGQVLADTPFFSYLIEGVEKECRANGMETIIYNLNKEDSDFDQALNQLLSDHSSAILLMATELNEQDVKIFENAVVPVVVLDAWFENLRFDTVIINNTDSACKAVEYLASKGHKEIGYLSSKIMIQNFYYREMGYRRAFDRLNMNINEDYIVKLEPTMDGAYRDMIKYLESKPKLPTAYFADNDIIALGAVKALKEAGYKVPNEVSVIGFDDMPFCDISSPALTTIKVFKHDMGQTAVKRLIEIMKFGNSINHKIEICTEFVERESVIDLRQKN